MQFTVNKQELLKRIDMVGLAVPSRPTRPVLANIVIKVSDNDITLIGFDLSQSIKTDLDRGCFTITEVGEATIPFKEFKGIISKTIYDTITISSEVQEDTETIFFSITAGTAKYNLFGLPTENYPELPKIEAIDEELKSVEIPLNTFILGTNFVRNFASNDETKQVLAGVNIQLKKDGLAFATTDGHRLGLYRTQLQDDLDLDESEVDEVSDTGVSEAETSKEITIPKIFINILHSLLNLDKNNAENLTINFSEELGTISYNENELTFRVLDGKFPNYSQLIPTDFARSIEFEAKTLAKQLDSAPVFIDKLLQMNFVDNDSITISVNGREYGSFKEEISGFNYIKNTDENSNFRIGFNHNYFTEGIKKMSGIIIFNCNQETQPAVITNDDFLYLIMPIQFRD